MTMPSIGLNIVPVPARLLVRYVQLAEELGFESVWSGEHVCLPHNDQWWKIYPTVVAAEKAGKDIGPHLVPFNEDTNFLEPLAVLAHLAAVTKKVRLGIGIYLVMLRDAILVGRSIATVDVLSGGRLDLGVGLGWTPDEYKFTNNEWESRGRKLDEMIRCLKTLFEVEHPEFHGEFFDFPPIGFQPKPIQKPLPIHIGGFGNAAVRRAAQLGDGWYGHVDLIPAVKEKLKEFGRENEPFKYGMVHPRATIDRDELESLAARGMERVVVTAWSDLDAVQDHGEDAPLRQLEAYAKRLGLA